MNNLMILAFTMPTWAPTILWAVAILIGTGMLSKTLLGWVFISPSMSGLVEKKWSINGDLPTGKIIATKGEAGVQAELLSPGLHFFKWWWMYSIREIDPIVIEPGKIGIVKAQNGKPLESGHILAKTVIDSNDFQDAAKFLDEGGVIGIQREILRNGTYRINTALFEVSMEDAIQIPEGKIGIVSVTDGKAISNGEIAARVPSFTHPKFQDADKFLNEGGERGLQEEILPPGEYYINPQFATVEVHDQVKVPIGHVAVATKYIGEAPQDTSGDAFRHGIIVSAGQKGVQKDPLNPGMYPINLRVGAVEIVPTTNIVLNWANAKNESHDLDSHLSTITARTKDGFAINLDVSQIINIAHDEAPKVIARFGTLKNLISQVLEPTIGNYFRNSVQERNAMEFINSRTEMQKKAKEFINEVLKEYNVVGVDTLIGDIIPPDQLMEPLRQKHIAEQNARMFEEQKKAEVTRKDFENAKAEADMQSEVVKSERAVVIAEKHADATIKKQVGDSKSIELRATAEANATKVNAEANSEATKKNGLAEAEVILEKGKSIAESYKLQTDAMGQENFTAMQIMKSLAESGIEIVPKILGGAGSGDSVNNLLGFEMLGRMGALPESMKKVSEVIIKKELKDATKK